MEIMKTIKFRTLGLALSLVLSVGVFAQEFHYGIKGGVNLAVQSEIADYYTNSDIRTGLHAGVFGNMSLNDKFSLQTEVNYEQKGSKSENITSNYDYISVPVLVKYSLGKSELTALKFNINVGPYAAFLINAENKVIYGDGVENTIDAKDDTENMEFGIITGIGMAYPIGNKNLTLDLRLGLGLTAFDKNDSDLSNKYVGISFGYEF